MSDNSTNTCSASTSRTSTMNEESSTTTSKNIPSFCVNEIPWKLVPQTCDSYTEYEFLDEMEGRLSDVESFVWKWSPCGRYGIDLPGGRENINHQLKNQMAIFDLHANNWTFYTIDNGGFEIPRVCFLYWARNDIIGTVSLVKDYEPGPDDDVIMKFKQSFYHISHETLTVSHAGSCKYRTDKTIIASYWYHIFENRRGEPFIDHNKNLWLIFSNGSDSLILLPFFPTPTCFDVKYVSFDMDNVVSQLIGSRVYLDPFMSSHFVPYVYRNDINFFIRIDTFSFIEEHNRDYSQDQEVEDSGTKDSRGIFHIRVNLKDVIEREEKQSKTTGESENKEIRFTDKDVEMWRKMHDDHRNERLCIAQHGKILVLQKWKHSTIDMSLSKKLSTRIANLDARIRCCSTKPRNASFCTVDLDSEKIREFDVLILGTDVIQPHPTGSVFMFRYKEIYGMSFCELPYFEPVSLRLKCLQVLSRCVHIDPNYYQTGCCLKIENDKDDLINELCSMTIEE